MFRPEQLPRSIHLGSIQQIRRRNVQLLLEYQGFPDCTLYWDDNVATPAPNAHHAGWCWITFPDIRTAGHAWDRLDGYMFGERKLFVGECWAEKVCLDRGRSSCAPLVYTHTPDTDIRSPYQISALHVQPFDPDPQTEAQSIYLTRILPTAPQTDIQSLFTMLGFKDCTFYWGKPKKDQTIGHHHRGWCWIRFPDTPTADRARACLDGLTFRGHALIVRVFSASVTDAAPTAVAATAQRPLAAPTLAQLLGLPAPAVPAKRVSHGTQTDGITNDNDNHHDNDTSCSCNKQTSEQEGNPKQDIQGDEGGQQEEDNQALQKENRGHENIMDREEDLMKFESPVRLHHKVSHRDGYENIMDREVDLLTFESLELERPDGFQVSHDWW